MIKFGTEGLPAGQASWTAKIADEFTLENVKRVSRAVANCLLSKKVAGKPLIISYDSRFLADKYAETTAKIVHTAGIPVLFTERDTPLPIIVWEVKDRGAVGAIMVSGDNNSAEISGVRLIFNDKSLIKEIQDRSESSNQIPDVNSQSQKANLERIEPRDRYFAYLETTVDIAIIKQAKLKIVVDPMYGSGRNYLDLYLQRLGCQVNEIHGYRDVLFGGSVPAPKAENLVELRDTIKEWKADLGIALSSSADYAVIIDDKGKLIGRIEAGMAGAIKQVEVQARQKIASKK